MNRNDQMTSFGLATNSHPVDAQEASTAGALADVSALHVLLVDDDASLTEALRLRLESTGVRATTSRDGLEARTALVTGDYDAVVLDLGLPDQNGLDLMLELAEQGELPPVVVLTGADASDCDLARVLGARHVLQKPCPFWLLSDAIQSATA